MVSIPLNLASFLEPQICLDHGFVRLVDLMGDDAAIVQAARVSYGEGTTTFHEDRGLIRYLYRHKHTTPFEMCEIKLHCKMPLFVARQWIRHRTANVNEVSARYSILTKEFYVPRAENVGVQSKDNKQGRGNTLDPEQGAWVLQMFRQEAERDYANYQALLNDNGDGTPVDANEPMVARELARMGLSLQFYTEWYWKIDLHNLLHFLSLRMDAHAQYEIRVFADVIGAIVETWCPFAWEAFNDFHPYRYGHTFSRQEMDLVRHLSCEGMGRPDRSQMKALATRFDIGSERERKAFWTEIGLLPKVSNV